MSIEQIIFNLLNKNAHTWLDIGNKGDVRLTMPGEYIEIMDFFLSGIELSDFSQPDSKSIKYNLKNRCRCLL
mgnify:CR=1 FL=1